MVNSLHAILLTSKKIKFSRFPLRLGRDAQPKMTYTPRRRKYLVCPIGCEIINKVLSHSTLKLVQGVLAHVHTTFISFIICCMTQQQKSYVAKSIKNYLTTIKDALTCSSRHLPLPYKKKPLLNSLNASRKKRSLIATIIWFWG